MGWRAAERLGPATNDEYRTARRRGSRRLRETLASVAAFAAVLAPMTARAEPTVKGRLKGAEFLLNPVWSEAADPAKHGYTFREPSPTVSQQAKILSAFLPKELCVVALAEGSQPQDKARITISGGRTTPVTVVVGPKQTIQFENHDVIPHRIYEVSGKGELAPVDIALKQTRVWTPPGPGVYELRDELAPSVRSWVVVESRAVRGVIPGAFHACGKVTRRGEFELVLPEGKYELQGYFNGKEVGARLPVEVRANPERQEIAEPLVVGSEAGKGG